MNSPRLVTLDMDGTLLDGSGHIPEEFWDILGRAKLQGMTLAPASGRQLATLRNMFEVTNERPDTFIAENGTVVWHKGKVVSEKPMRKDVVTAVLNALEDVDFPVHVVLCKAEKSHTDENLPTDVTAEVDKYYHANEHVKSLRDVVDSHVVKLALYVETDAERDALPVVREAAPDHTLAVSSKHWLDVMAPGANKGVALKDLAKSLGIAQEDTAAIGDYLNDYELLQAAGTAVAMENAHPDLKAIADEITGTNLDHGALTTLRKWLN